MSVVLDVASSNLQTVEILLPANTTVAKDSVIAVDPAQRNQVKVAAGANAVPAATDLIAGVCPREISATTDEDFAIDRKIVVVRDTEGEYKVDATGVVDPLAQDDVNFSDPSTLNAGAAGVHFRALGSRITTGTDGILTGRIVAWS